MSSLESVTKSQTPEFLQLVQLAIDGALRPDQERAFFRQINSCPQCLDAYYKERNYKIFIKNKVAKKCCEKEQLIERIKGHLDDFRSH